MLCGDIHYLIITINCNLRDRVSFINPRLQQEAILNQHHVLFCLFSSLKHSIYRTYIMPVAKISPSMLSCDFAYLAVEAKRMEKNGADWLHLGKVNISLAAFVFSK